MDRNVNLILFFFGLCIPSSYVLRQFTYVNLQMSWEDAQHYCRVKYTDLATFESMKDISRLIRPTLNAPVAWIGLWDNPQSWQQNMGNDSNSWRWSATGETSKTGYKNWNYGESNYYGASELCGLMNPNGAWNDAFCNLLYYFVCYTETNQTQKTYVLITIGKTWTDARDYCRQHYTDLPTIETQGENTNVYNVKANYVVWIGLYRVPWTWSDNSKSLIRNWASGKPDNTGGTQHCVTENYLHQWDDDTCSKTYPFICYIDAKLKIVVRMEIKTDADLTDPATNSQILQQLDEVLTSQGGTDFELQWKIQPRKQEKLRTDPQCILHS